MNIQEKLSRFVQGTAVVLAISLLVVGSPINATPEKHNLEGEGWTANHPHTKSRSGCLEKSTSNVGGSIGGSVGPVSGSVGAGHSWTNTGCWAAPQEGDEYMHYHDIPENKVDDVRQGRESCEEGESFRVDIEVEDTREEVTKTVWKYVGLRGAPGIKTTVIVVEGELTITYLGGKCLSK